MDFCYRTTEGKTDSQRNEVNMNTRLPNFGYIEIIDIFICEESLYPTSSSTPALSETGCSIFLDGFAVIITSYKSV